MAATTWISTGSTSWNTGANWSLGTVPTSADDVTFNATSVINCTCDVAISCASINVTSGYSGTLNFGSGSYNHSIALDTVFAGTGTVDRGNATLTVGGNYNISSQGTFTNSSGVTILTGTGKTLTSSTTNRPRNITVQTGASITFTSTGIGFAYGAWTINGSLTLSSTFQGLSEPTWIINGTVTGTAYQQIKNCSITLNGTGTITGQLFLWLEGQVFTHNGGTIGPDVYLQLYLSSTITGASPFTLTAKGVRFKGSSAAYTTTIAQSITFDCPVVNLHTEAGLLTISTSGSNPSLTFKKDVNLYNTGSITWQKGTGTITLSGTAAQSINFNALSVETIVVDKTAGTATFEANVSPTAFTVSQGTVNINGKTITTTQHVTAAAGTTVNDTVGGGKFVVGGNFAANGTSGSGVIWNGPDLQITGTATANYATVTNSNATGGTAVTATNSTDGGGNTNWVFGPAAGETIDLTGLTGDFTLSVYGTAAVTVAAGTATGTGFGQATEGNPVTFNLSVTGTVTLTLDSGTLDTYQGAAMKQVEQGAVSTPFIKTSGGPGSRTIDQILHPWSESVLSQAQGSIILKVKLKQGTFTPTADRGLVTIHTSVNNILYLNSGDAISAESADGTNTVNSGVVAQSVDDELGIYVSWANSTIYPASGNISVGLKNLTTGSAWAESTGNYDGGYPETASILRLLSGLTCEATIEDLVVYDKLQHPVKLKELFWQGMTDWGYRKSIVLTGSSDGVLTDYQKKIIVHRTAGTDTGSDVYLNGICNSDMSDIRFLDTEGNLLSYWQETRSLQTAAAADTDNRAVFWVKIPRIARSPAKTGIFIYYGNASAPSLSSGSDTFILFDDFDSASGNSAGVDLDNFDCLELDATIGSAELLTQSGMKEIGNVIYEPADTGKEYKMAYSAGSALLTAYSSDGKNWTKYSEIGLISGVEDPWIFAEGGTYYCYGEIKSGGNTDDLGLWTATDMGGPWSFDSVMITKAVVAGWRDSIVGSPVVWKESSTYYMNYEGVGTGSLKNGQGLATASSPDGPWTEQNTDTVPMTGFEKASGRYAWNGDVISDDHRKIDSTYYCPMHSGVQVKSQPEFPYGTLLGLYKSTDAVSGSMVWSEDPRSPIVWPDLNNSEHFQVFPIDSELYALTYADEWEPEPLGIKLAKFVQANESGIDTDIWDYGHKGQTGRIGVAGGNAVIDVYDSPAGGNGCCTYFQTKTAALPAADFAVLFRVHNPNATMAVSVGTNNTVQGSSGGASLWYDTRLGDGYSAKWYTSYRNRVYKTANAGAQTQVGAEWVGKDHNYNTWMPGTELVYLADGTIEWTVEGVTQYTDLDATYVSGAKYLQFAMGNYSDGRSDGFRILVDYVAVANRTANEPTITYGLEESE